MFDKLIIFFFYFFLFSRFLSEKVNILPKYIDIINFPLFAVLLVLLVLNLKKRIDSNDEDSVIISRAFFAFSLFFFISIIFNNYRVLWASSVLFYAGFMEGPVLFLSLEKLVKNRDNFINNINKIFFVTLIINIIIIFIIDLPVFFITGNPDLISGSYGNNTYQFSLILLICGGYLLGYNHIKKKRTVIIIISQLLLWIIFYLTQFRAGLPFFMLAYLFMIGKLYGRKLMLRLIPFSVAALFLFSIIVYITKQEEKIEALNFADWLELASNPTDYFRLGKFSIYGLISEMFVDYPETAVIGTGPGNFMSRANYTFSYELLVQKKGVALIIKELTGIQYPNFTVLHNEYIIKKIKSESVFGTWQLSKPYTSYLSPITEIGIIGGISILIVYIFMVYRSLKLYNIISETAPKFIPLSLAFIGGSIYLFGLGFLDNNWETARYTLPVWLLYWTVKTIARNSLNQDNN